jgi:protein-tyrosine kinase
MSTAAKPAWREPPAAEPLRPAPRPEPRVQSLLDLQRGLQRGDEDEAPPPAMPEPALLTPANLKAFHLLRKNAPEAYLNQFRQLRGRLFRKREMTTIQGRKLKTLLISSPEVGDGKTFVALNLGLMMAVAPGCRVLLVDLNVDRPAFHSRLLLPQTPGLREVIAGMPWQAAARKVPHMDLFVVCRGETDRAAMDPVNYPLLRRWLAEVGEHFEWVLLDGPALNGSPDAEILSHHADGVLMVLRAGQSGFDQTDEAVARVDASKLVGAVFNGRA